MARRVVAGGDDPPGRDDGRTGADRGVAPTPAPAASRHRPNTTRGLAMPLGLSIAWRRPRPAEPIAAGVAPLMATVPRDGFGMWFAAFLTDIPVARS